MLLWPVPKDSCVTGEEGSAPGRQNIGFNSFLVSQFQKSPNNMKPWNHLAHNSPRLKDPARSLEEAFVWSNMSVCRRDLVIISNPGSTKIRDYEKAET